MVRMACMTRSMPHMARWLADLYNLLKTCNTPYNYEKPKKKKHVVIMLFAAFLNHNGLPDRVIFPGLLFMICLIITSQYIC